MQLDLRVIGGTVLDGTGAAARAADVGVRDGRIVAVAEPGSLPVAAHTIVATGRIVSPGFVTRCGTRTSTAYARCVTRTVPVPTTSRRELSVTRASITYSYSAASPAGVSIDTRALPSASVRVVVC